MAMGGWGYATVSHPYAWINMEPPTGPTDLPVMALTSVTVGVGKTSIDAGSPVFTTSTV
jgi:hypothetical protein